MQQFMVVSTFRDGVNMQEVLQHVEAEKAKVKELQDEGRLGGIRMAVPQRKVFLDVFADDEDGACSTVQGLPMAMFWDLEVYKLSGTA